jgi:N-methylhydantoinase A
MAWLAGVDVGGTFTDVVLYDPVSGEVRINKVLTTQNQAEGFMSGLQAISSLPDIRTIVHGTTIGTNAILERKGARTGLITTRGFRDILELGRRTRPQTYGMTGQFEPLVPREWRMEVDERVGADGDVLTPLNQEEVRQAARQLADDAVESLAVVFLHSYANPKHEQEARHTLTAAWRNGFVSLSHEVLPEVGEFERTSTTVINAYLQPLLDRYLTDLREKLRRAEYRRPFRIMQSNGGALTLDTAVRQACRSVLSGPSAGLVAAAWIGRQAGHEKVIAADMGGTSFDVGVVLGGEPTMAPEKEIDYGIPTGVPMVDIVTIGSGGGSIAWINDAGLLHVGPESAGAHPGPICHGRGGNRPTLTDANVLLRRLDVRNIMPVGRAPTEESRAAFAQLGTRLGLTAEETAEATVRIANLSMANAIKRVSIEKGLDPRSFTLMAFGGGGPLHACSLASELSIPRILIPPWPGVTSALGCLLADARHDEVWSIHQRVRNVSTDSIRHLFDQMIKRIRAIMMAEGIEPSATQVRYEAELQYEGQTHTLHVLLPSAMVTAQELLEQFEAEYRRRFGVTVNGVPVQLINLHVRSWASRTRQVKLKLPRPATGSADAARQGTRSIRIGNEWYDTAVYDRWRLPQAAVVPGPACIEQTDTTTLVLPGWVARTDRLGNIVMTQEEV